MSSAAGLAPAPRERMPRLDGLRGVAILLVLAGHAGYHTFGQERVGELAGLGVLLFFVLSGYLITGLLQREQASAGAVDLRAFYARRALRILPAFWLLMAVVCALMLLGVVTDVTWGAVAACLLFVRNWVGRGQTLSHVWTLSLEEQFYVLWPALLAGLGARRALGAAVAVTLACVLWRGYAVAAGLYPYASDVFYLRTDFRLDSLFAGCCLALAATRNRWAAALRVVQGVPLRATVPAVLAWALGASAVPALRPVFLTIETLLVTLLFGRLLAAGLTPAVRVLEHPTLTWLGRLSYSVYLWQQLFLVRTRSAHDPGRALSLALLGIAGAALLSYVAVERTALALRARWAPRLALGVA